MSTLHTPVSPVEDEPVPGFSFDNIHRNRMILSSQVHGESSNNAASILPMATKTGTTIVGMVYKGGVVLGDDRTHLLPVGIIANGYAFSQQGRDGVYFVETNVV